MQIAPPPAQRQPAQDLNLDHQALVVEQAAALDANKAVVVPLNHILDNLQRNTFGPTAQQIPFEVLKAAVNRQGFAMNATEAKSTGLPDATQPTTVARFEQISQEAGRSAFKEDVRNLVTTGTTLAQKFYEAVPGEVKLGLALAADLGPALVNTGSHVLAGYAGAATLVVTQDVSRSVKVINALSTHLEGVIPMPLPVANAIATVVAPVATSIDANSAPGTAHAVGQALGDIATVGGFSVIKNAVVQVSKTLGKSGAAVATPVVGEVAASVEASMPSVLDEANVRAPQVFTAEQHPQLSAAMAAIDRPPELLVAMKREPHPVEDGGGQKGAQRDAALAGESVTAQALKEILGDLDWNHIGAMNMRRELTDRLQAAMKSGALPPGAQLPTTVELAHALGPHISDANVLQAYNALAKVSEGSIDSKPWLVQSGMSGNAKVFAVNDVVTIKGLETWASRRAAQAAKAENAVQDFVALVGGPLDLSKGKTLTRQLTVLLAPAIEKLPPGTLLPSTTQLAPQYSVTPIVVHMAYEALACQGRLIRSADGKKVAVSASQEEGLAVWARQQAALAEAAAVLQAKRASQPTLHPSQSLSAHDVRGVLGDISGNDFSDIGRAVADKLEREIRRGTLPPGSQLPSTVTLAAEYSFSYKPIQAAYDRLADSGLIVRTYRQAVVADAPTLFAKAREGLTQTEQGLEVVTRQVSHLDVVVQEQHLGKRYASSPLGELVGVVDPTSGITKCTQLMNRLQSRIDNGTLPAGFEFSTMKQLGVDFGVNKGTVLEAFTGLEHIGYLEKIGGAWHVADVRPLLRAKARTQLAEAHTQAQNLAVAVHKQIDQSHAQAALVMQKVSHLDTLAQARALNPDWRTQGVPDDFAQRMGKISKPSDIPQSAQVVDRLRSLIDSGALHVGAAVPNTAELARSMSNYARQMDASASSVAYHELVEAGYLVRDGNTWRVADVRPQLTEAATNLRAQARALSEQVDAFEQELAVRTKQAGQHARG